MTIYNSYLEGEVGRADNMTRGVHRRLRMTGNQNLTVAQYEPEYTGMAEAGRIYCAQPGVVANAIASAVDTPTTGAQWALYNGAPATSNIALLILGVSFFSASGTIGIGAALLGGVSSAAQASAVTTTAGNLIYSTCGSSRTTVATYDSTLTLTGQPAWMALATSNTPSGVAIGYGGSNYDLKGMFLVPRTYCFAMAVVSPTGTNPAFLASVVYAEVETTNYV